MQNELKPTTNTKPVDLDHKWEPAWRVFQIVLALACVLGAWEVQRSYADGTPNRWLAAFVIGLVIYGIVIGIWRLSLASVDLVKDIQDGED